MSLIARPGTFVLTMPDGQEVLCWSTQAADIRRDVALTGEVALRRDPLSGVYERLATGSQPPDGRVIE